MRDPPVSCFDKLSLRRWAPAFRRRADADVCDGQGRLMRIAVMGARGQLGAAVVHACAPAHEVVGQLLQADLACHQGTGHGKLHAEFRLERVFRLVMDECVRHIAVRADVHTLDILRFDFARADEP